MTYEDVLEHYGNGVETAKALNINSSAVYQWGRKGQVPTDTQFKIEVLTDGQLQADREQEKEHEGS